MSKNVKNYLIVIIICLGIILNSCEKDAIDSNTKANQEIIVKNISLNEIYDLNVDKKLIEAVEQLKKIQNLKGKLVYNSQFNFYIDDEKGIYYEKDGIKSYTFQIFREIESDKIENIVFVLNNSNEIEIFNTKYSLSINQIEDLSQDRAISLTNINTNFEINSLNLKYISGACYDDEIVSIPASTNEQGQITSSFVYIIRTLKPCPDNHEGGESGATTGNSNPFYGNYTSNTNSTNTSNGTTTNSGGAGVNNNNVYIQPPPILTSPIVTTISQAESRLRNTFRNELNPQQKTFFDRLTNLQKLKFYRFLTAFENPDGNDITVYNPVAINFAQNVINWMIANPGVFKSFTPFIIEKKIKDEQLDVCAKNVLTNLKNTTVCDIAQVLAKLDADAMVYNTTIKTETLPNGNTSPATTKWNSPFNYTIYISPNYTGKTKLFRASLILHEMVHAYFLSLKDDYFYSNPPNLNSLSDFTNLFHYYVTLKYPLSLNSYDFQHQQMATDYVDAIARALQEYQTGIPVPNTSQPNQIYNDLAWFGLIDTPVFDNMFPIGNPNLQRILNRGAAEQTGNAIDAGTPNAQFPIGNPCN